MVRLLLDQKADMFAVDNNGKTPYGCARDEILELFKSEGANLLFEDNGSVLFLEHPFSWSWHKFIWLLVTLIFFLLTSSPARSWVIEAEETESEAVRLSKLLPSWVKSLPSWVKSLWVKSWKSLPSLVKSLWVKSWKSLPEGLVVGVLVFTAYYIVVAKLEEAFILSSKISLPPGTGWILCAIVSMLPFLLLLSDFSKLRLKTLFVMLVFMVIITCRCSLDFSVFFFITLTINLQLAYGRSFAWVRWFFRIFVAIFCTKAISHFVGITHLFLILFLTIATGKLYTFVNSRIHHRANNAIMIRDKFQLRYFQRGTAKAQMYYIKRRLTVFLFIIGVTILSTLGHLYPWPTFDYGSEITANVFCKIGKSVQLACQVKTNYNDPYSESQDCKSGSQEWDYCGSWHATSDPGGFKSTRATPPAGCTCPASGACLSSNPRALVLAASQYTTPLDFADLSANDFGAMFDYLFYGFQDFLSRYTPLSFFISSAPKHASLAASDAKRKGFDVYFTSGNSWETKIENWAYPFELVNGYEKWSLRNKSTMFPKEVHMKMQTHMMTTTGFTSIQRTSSQEFQQLKGELEHNSHPKEHYIALSGGGWRAMTSHMGSFRSMSNKGALKKVKMISSVSGGSWALSNLAFDDQFSRNVLRNQTPISNVVSKWFEGKYFPTVRDTMCFKDNETGADSKTAAVTRLLSTSILQGIDFFKSKLGAGIIAANFFNFSWQSLVEQTILGEHIARQPLDTITFAPDARVMFGNATVALNWNHLNKWNGAKPSACSKFYLQESGGKHVQYPVYATALYKQHSDDDGVDFEVKFRGQPMDGAFDLCYKTNDDFCVDSPDTSYLEIVSNQFSSLFGALSNLFTSSSEQNPINQSDHCLDFELKDLTLGQVVSASSAAAGGVSVQPWVESIFELVRQHAKDALGGGTINHWYCSHYQMLIKKFVTMCNHDIVVDEFLRVLGCETSDGTKEDANSAATRWSSALERMAIRMTANNPSGDAHSGYMAIDAGYTDNSGLAPIISEYLKNTSTKGHVTVLISNQLGDHQMETYFESTPNDGGMICKDGEGMEEQFDKIKEIHQRSFKDVGGEFVPRDGEKPCSIRLASAVFFKGHPPKHHRFKDKRIPAHITYAYKKNVTIIKNDDFYQLPDNGSPTIDLLFLMSHAPVPTASFPEAGSEAYVGLANAMELAMDELSTMFPEILSGDTKSSNREDPQSSPDVSSDDVDQLNQKTLPEKDQFQSIMDQMTDLLAKTDKLSRQLSPMTPSMQAKIFGNTAADQGENQLKQAIQRSGSRETNESYIFV